MSGLLRLKTSDDNKLTCTHRVVRFAVAKELLSNPLVGKLPLSASTSHLHYGVSMIKPGVVQPGSDIKTGSVMARWNVFVTE